MGETIWMDDDEKETRSRETGIKKEIGFVY